MIRIDEPEKLNFPHDFFDDEVREGFYVPSMMKRAWAAQLSVLNVIGRICKKHNIRYYTDSGSLLGALRHGGFIPWDDDFDLCMLREDYDKFYEAAKTELPEGYVLLEIRENKDFDDLLMRIVNSANFNFSDEFLTKYCGFPFPAGVDIFPLDNLYDEGEEKKEEERIRKLKSINDAFNAFENVDSIDDRQIRRAISMVESLCHTTLRRDENLSYNLLLLQDRLYRENKNNNSKKVAMMPYFVKSGGKGHIYERSIFDETVYIPFEDFLIPAPVRFDRVSEVEYGNYMNIRHAWGTHDFPYYGWMEDELKRLNGYNPYRYQIDQNLFINILDVSEAKKRGIREKAEGEKKNILFLPWKDEGFEAIKPLYESYLLDDDLNVTLSFIPYQIKDTMGELHEWMDKDREKEGVLDLHYDEIIITQPFDNMCFTASFEGKYIIENLYNKADNIILVPYIIPTFFKDDKIKQQSMLKDFLLTPGFLISDKILVPAEDIKNLFSEIISLNMEKLIGIDTREFFDYKIEVEPKLIKKAEKKEDESFCPDKKTIVYFVSMTSLLKYKEKAIEKIKRSREVFEESKDSINLLFLPESLLESSENEWDDVIERIEPSLLSEWENIINDLLKYSVKNEDNVKSPKEFVSYLARSCDAFYGDAGYVAHIFRENKKPVMIQNFEV